MGIWGEMSLIIMKITAHASNLNGPKIRFDSTKSFWQVLWDSPMSYRINPAEEVNMVYRVLTYTFHRTSE